nr:hypothetical protein [uncultured Vibrio sp.]
MKLLEPLNHLPLVSWTTFAIATYVAFYVVELYEAHQVRKFHQKKAFAYNQKLLQAEVDELNALVNKVSDHVLINHAYTMINHGVGKDARYQVLAGIYSGEFLK